LRKSDCIIFYNFEKYTRKKGGCYLCKIKYALLVGGGGGAGGGTTTMGCKPGEHGESGLQGIRGGSGTRGYLKIMSGATSRIGKLGRRVSLWWYCSLSGKQKEDTIISSSSNYYA